MSRRPPPLWLGGLFLAGLASLSWGLWLQFRPPSTPASTNPVSTTPTNPVSNPVQAGSGTWTAPAPEAHPASAGRCPQCDIVLITLCSLRRDALGIYGASPSPSPNLDALAEGAFRMDQAWAASNFTLAGLTAVLTGRFGSTTGVTGWDKGLVKDVPTLPEILGYYGYRTGGFTIDAPSGFRPDYGLDRGFQLLKIIPAPRDTPDGRTGSGPIGPGGTSARPAAEWIAAQDRNTPIFAMFHSRTAHYPFVLQNDPSDPTGVSQLLWESGGGQARGQAMPGTAGGTAQRGVVAIRGPDPVQEGVKKAGEAGLLMWKQRYREAVARMDLDLGVIAEALKVRGRPTILVILADHGESLGDHGELLHGDAYFDGVVHIPMLVKIPELPGHPIEALSSQVDLLPTLLELVGARVPAGIDGASLLPLLDGTQQKIRSTTLVEGGVSWHNDAIARGAVISPPWALLRQDRGCGGGPEAPRKPGEPAVCLYHLEDDPGQERNVAAEHPDIIKDLLSRWDKFRIARGSTGETLTLDPAYVRQLQQTGYDFRPGPP